MKLPRLKTAKQTEANRESKNSCYAELPWFLVTLLAFMMIDFLNLSRSG
jgi:hypothetical protein